MDAIGTETVMLNVEAAAFGMWRKKRGARQIRRAFSGFVDFHPHVGRENGIMYAHQDK